MKIKAILISACFVNICSAAPDFSGFFKTAKSTINTDEFKNIGSNIVESDKFKQTTSTLKKRLVDEVRNIIKPKKQLTLDNLNIKSLQHDIPWADKYNYQELVKHGFDLIIDDKDHKVEIPMSRPRNVLKLTELLINAIVDRDDNEQNVQKMREILEKIKWLQSIENENLDQIFCKNYDTVYKLIYTLSESLEGRLLELKKIFEDLMFFMRVSAYMIKLNRYFEKHEEEILKHKKDLEVTSTNYNLINIPPELVGGVDVGISVKHAKRIGKLDGTFITANDVALVGKVGYAFNIAIDKLASINGEIELRTSREERHLNAFDIASLQDDVWSDKNYSKFKELLHVLLCELSSLKENLYNLDLRLKTIGIIQNDLSYYFDRGQYTTEYIKSFSFGGRVSANVSLLHAIGLDAALCYKLSRHKLGKNRIPDNIKNYSVILNNRDYSLSLVKLFNSGKVFSKILDSDSSEYVDSVKAKGILSVSDLRFQIDNYLHALRNMYQQDKSAVEIYRDLKHTIEKDLGVSGRRDTAEFFAEIIAYFCFIGKDFNGNQCNIKELTSLKDSLMLIINTLDDSRSIFSHRKELRSQRAYSHDVTANISLGRMLDFYCQFNDKKTRLYDNGQMMHIDINTSMLNFINTICLSKLPINNEIKEIFSDAITTQGGEYVSNVFFKICNQIKSRAVSIIGDNSNALDKYISSGISLLSDAVGKLPGIIVSNCENLMSRTPLKMLTDVNMKDSHIRIDFVANSLEEKAPIMTRISNAPNMSMNVNLLTSGSTVTLKEHTVMFINTLTVYELVKEFIKHAMEYEANHGVAVSLDIANKFVDKYKFIDGLVKSAQLGRLNSSYKKYANATKHKSDFHESLKGKNDDEVKHSLSMLVYRYYLDKAKPFFEASFK